MNTNNTKQVTDYLTHVEYASGPTTIICDLQCNDLKALQDRVIRLTDNQVLFQTTGEETFNINTRDGIYAGWICNVPVPAHASVRTLVENRLKQAA